MKNLLRTGATVLILLALGACKTPLPAANDVPVRDGSADQTPTADSRAVKTVEAPDELGNPNGALAKRSIYFDYDSFVVKDEFRGTVEAHARYLQSHKTRRIVIQGNADERGGSEYNLALGQKRSEAVRRALALLGVAESQVEAVSLGKEKPKALGHDEAAWAENRRADIVYQ